MKNIKYISNIIGAFATTISTDIEKEVSELGGRSLSHEAALVAIHNHPNETIDVLSKVLALTHSGTVRLINTLEKEGLVMRCRSAQDARSVVLCTTNDGNVRVQLILDSRERVALKLLENFNDEQKQSFLELLVIAMGHLTDEKIVARRICRFCNEGICRKLGCPVEQAVKRTM
ncbi:MarR family winged helix-turn-helix transcriptional regulator [Colwellia psychrerythraea]|uniref:Transcriptional regulator, MarR family n=1 Tax=Colwellia psychrerythraea TaxID=28229 RepID=A0A099KA43_COLPS|nr:MarR family transcriptional regulator [Colwellia psychrerythraea]KGJ87211.1 transcriptional regulator, MarR family [Colwellia psychrerythraea]